VGSLWGEGYNAAGWDIGGSLEQLLQVQSMFIRTMGGH